MKDSQIRIAVIGYGYWGPNLVRNFYELKDARVRTVCELRPERRVHLERHYPGVEMVQDWRQVVRSPDIDAVVVATPVSSHFTMAREALRQGKHALVEKPLALTTAEARELVELADAGNRVLMVGHTFLYHGAIRKIRELIGRGELGELLYVVSTRANLGILQDDINVVWDLAPHDISIMDFLVGQSPVAVSATGASHTERGLEDVAFITFHYRDNLIGHVSVNWLSPVKIRTMLFGGTRKMILYDDNEPSEKVKVYDRGLDRSGPADARHNELIQHRAGDVFVPQLDLTEALQAQSVDFLQSIREGRRPCADGESGLRVVALLEMTCRSLAQGGVPVEVEGFPLEVSEIS